MEDHSSHTLDEHTQLEADPEPGLPEQARSRSTDQPSFAQWASTVSQRLNRSLAGSRLVLSDDTNHDTTDRTADLLRLQAQEWGMIPCEHASAPAFQYPLQRPADDLSDAPASRMLDYAHEHMTVLRTLMPELQHATPFAGISIATSLIIEPKTAVFLTELAKTGARVGVYCGPDSTNERVADWLRNQGILVQANREWKPEQCHAAALQLVDELQPQIVVDDGASFARLISLERPQTARQLIGVAEETTSGVRAFQAMDARHQLDYPVIAVNDSPLKTGFDNRHGTGETCITTLLRLLGANAFDHRTVVVVGFGPVGEGFAMRVRSLGARVIVCDINPVAALNAVFKGFNTGGLDEVLPQADFVVSATGVRHTITLHHLQSMNNHTVVAVIGGIANEIALDEVPSFKPTVGESITKLPIPDGPTITLISQGDGVNYTAGGGNPIEIMDLSFAVQASAIAQLIRANQDAKAGRSAPLPHHVLHLDPSIDRTIAIIALASRGFGVANSSDQISYDWKLTRFADSDS